MTGIEREFIRTTAILRAAEDWSGQYTKDPTTHAQLLKSEARLQLQINRFLKWLATEMVQRINWFGYMSQVKADYNVDVIVQDLPDNTDGTFLNLVIEPMATLTATGASAGETIYKVPLGIQSTDAIIQQLTKEHIASLVGKKLNPDGSIVDNPKARFNINETTRKNIAESIKTSLALGENIQEAQKRLQGVIASPMRAELIAQTESVNAYQQGLSEFGRQSGAVGKESLDVNAIDQCAEFSALGPVPLDYLYAGIYDGPAYHGRCRCGRRLIYTQEWNQLFPDGYEERT